MAIVFELGIGSAIFKSILYNDDIDEDATYSTAFYFTIITSLGGMLPFLLYRKEVSFLIIGSHEYSLAFCLLIFSVFFRTFSIIPFAKLRIEDRSVTYVILALLKFLLQIGLNIYFVVVLRQGILGISWAYFLSSFILILAFLYIIKPNLHISFSTAILKDMLDYGLPLVPGALALFIMNMSNRYFLKHYSSVEQVALFSLGYYIGLIVNLMVYAFQRVWASLMFKIAKEEDAQRIFAQNFTYFVLILGFTSLVLSIFSREIVGLLTTEEYFDSYKVVPYICLSFLFYGIYFYLSYGMNIKKMTRYQPVIIGISASLNLLLNFVLIPKYSMLGAAAASAISFALMGVLAGIISGRFYPVSLEVKRLVCIAVIIPMVFICGFYVRFDSAWMTMSLKLIFVIAAMVLFFITNFFSTEEKNRMRRLIFKDTIRLHNGQ